MWRGGGAAAGGRGGCGGTSTASDDKNSNDMECHVDQESWMSSMKEGALASCHSRLLPMLVLMIISTMV